MFVCVCLTIKSNLKFEPNKIKVATQKKNKKRGQYKWFNDSSAFLFQIEVID